MGHEGAKHCGSLLAHHGKCAWSYRVTQEMLVIQGDYCDSLGLAQQCSSSTAPGTSCTPKIIILLNSTFLLLQVFWTNTPKL